MRLERIHLDGFGQYSDYPMAGFDQHLTVIHGPNEAGKSTLLAFIRHVLFGFPPGNSRENRYMVRESGTHGGRLHVVTGDGDRYRIERQRGGRAAGTVTLSADDDTALDASELPQLLGHASRSLFESIFAFDLDALASFDSADDAEIGSRLYGAGVGVSRLPDMLRTIGQERDRLFLPSGRKNQLVAKVLNQLDDVNKEIRAAQDQSAEFARLSRELGETTDLIADIDQRRATQEQRRTGIEQLASAWDPWVELSDIRHQLAEMPRFDSFPENAVSRLEGIEERLKSARDDAATASAGLERTRETASQTVPHRALLDHAGPILTIREQRGAFQGSVQDLPARQAELKAEEAQLQEDLNALGSDWTVERLNAFDLSIARRDEVTRWSENIDTAEQTRHDRQRDAESLRANLADAEDRRQELERQQAESQSPSTTNADSGMSMLRSLLVPGSMLVIGILLAVAGWALDQELFVGLGMGAFVAGLLFAGYTIASRSVPVQPVHGLPGVDGGQLAESTHSVERLQSRVEDAESIENDAVAAADAVAARWVAWLSDRALPETLTTTGASEFLSRVDEARQHAGSVDERRDRAAAIERDIASYRTLVIPVGEAAEVPVSDDPLSIANAAGTIAELYDAARDADQQRLQAEEAVKEREQEVAKQERREKAIGDEYDALLAAGGTADVEEFRRLAAQHVECQRLEAQERELTGALKRIVGPDTDLDALDQTLAATSRELIAADQTEVQQDLTDLSVERDEALELGAELRASLTSLHGDEEASRLRAAHATLQDELQAHAAEWSRWSVAQALLEQARRRYEQERQPAVIERASGYFADLTGGRYVRLYKPLDEPGFRVIEGESEAQKAPEQLSRGTREQLYLALRLAAIDEFGQRQERLPVLVDEILVNFDPVRARQAAIAFGNLAKQNQVIVFTCHAWVRDLFRDVVPAAAVIELSSPAVGAH